MAVVVVHPFVNPKADGADTTITRPSDWNANHTITGLGTAATANTTDFDAAGAAAAAQAFAIQRANHTGTQTVSTISDLAAYVAARISCGA